MKEQKVIVGEFEDELYAEIARKDLKAAGINANILKDESNVYILFSENDNAVRLVIPGTHIEKARKILERKFF
jgi:hypothetical protein